MIRLENGVRYLYHWWAPVIFDFSTCIIGGLGEKLLASLAGSVLFWVVLLASLVGCAVRYLHHWQARCYFGLVLFWTCATCIIGGLGVILDFCYLHHWWAVWCATCIIGRLGSILEFCYLCKALLVSLAGSVLFWTMPIFLDLANDTFR